MFTEVLRGPKVKSMTIYLLLAIGELKKPFATYRYVRFVERDQEPAALPDRKATLTFPRSTTPPYTPSPPSSTCSIHLLRPK